MNLTLAAQVHVLKGRNLLRTIIRMVGQIQHMTVNISHKQTRIMQMAME